MSAPIRLAPPQPPPWATVYGVDRKGILAEFEVDGVVFPLRWIPPGRFRMGSAETEDRYDRELPRHEVVIPSGFWLGETPVTQEQWKSVTGENPSEHQDAEQPGLPVEKVSWDDCEEFFGKLNKEVEGLGSRFPTEAEWEYACRAGTESAFNDGSDCTEPEGKDPALEKLGWHGEGFSGNTHPVGLKKANAWGLHDMHGNVWEWCWDGRRTYTEELYVDELHAHAQEGSYRALRGGSCWYIAGYCRSAYRGAYPREHRIGDFGLRLLAPGQESPPEAEGGPEAR